MHDNKIAEMIAEMIAEDTSKTARELLSSVGYVETSTARKIALEVQELVKRRLLEQV